ncbi:DUF6339 family protein [Halalkalicoccus sp. GCM10025322]
MDLKRLTNNGKVAVQMDPDFLTLDGDPIKGIEDHVKEDVDGEFDEERLRTEIERVMRTYDNSSRSDRNAMDAELAPVVHQAINLSRRTATYPGIWWYLTVVEFPEYVRYRWMEGNLSEKFIGIADEPTDRDTAHYDSELTSMGTIKDPYSIALNRLWWAAELTYDRGTEDYFATQKMFFPQRLANYILDSKFRRYPDAAQVFADVFTRVDTETIDTAADRFKRSLSLYQLETRSERALRDQLEAIKGEVASE